MLPIDAYNKIREVCLRRPDLAWKDSHWPNSVTPKNVGKFKLKPYQGHCYVASHAFTILVPGATLHTNETKGHYWNELDGEVWDLTKEQFDYEFDYSSGRKVPKKNKPTKRVAALLEEIDV